MQPILTLKEVSFWFQHHEKPLLTKVSFQLEQGEHLYIIGESGSGKSTLMKLIAGLQAWQEGEIHFKRLTLRGASNQTIPGHREIVLADQRFSADPNLTVAENMKERLFGLGLTPEIAQKRIDKVLKVFQLQHKANQKIKLLSGGEAQRASLAKTFVRPAQLYLLDEPFSHLDYITRTLVLKKLYQLTGKAAIIEVAHQPEDFLKVGSRLIVLHKGTIEAIGEATDLYFNPPTKHIAKLTGNYNVIHASDYTRINGAESFKTDGVLGLRPEKLFATPAIDGNFEITQIMLKAGRIFALCVSESKVPYLALLMIEFANVGSLCHLKC